MDHSHAKSTQNRPNLHQGPGSGASIDPTSGLDIDAQQVDHLLIVKAFADDLNLVETVNRLHHRRWR